MESRKGAKARLLTCGGIFLLLCAGVAVLIFACLDLPVQSQRQADGSTLSLLGYTTPAEPELITGPPLFRLLAPLLSNGQQSRIGVRRLRHPGGALGLWLKQTGGDPSKRFNAFAMPFQYEQIATATDSDGRMSSLPWSMDFESSRNFDDNPVYRRLMLKTLPRRGGSLTIRVYRFDRPLSMGPIAVFRLSNPYSARSPEWTAKNMPLRQAKGEFEVELTSVKTGLQIDESSSHSPFPFAKQGIWSQAELKVREKGVATNDWELERVWVEDATGNAWDATPEVRSVSQGVLSAKFPGNLWDEPAWRIRLRFGRVRGFARNDTCVLDVRIPPKGRIKGTEESVSIGETRLRFAGAAAMNETWPLSDGSLINISSPTVFVHFSGKSDEDRIALVSVRDSESELERIEAPSVKDGRTHAYELFFMTPPGPVKLRFATHQVKEFEFMVRPERVVDTGASRDPERGGTEANKPDEVR